MSTVDPALVSVAVVVPVILIVFNLVIMGNYLDAQATAGHYIAKFFSVSVFSSTMGRVRSPSPLPADWQAMGAI